jgi:alpha-2-macroglobulin
MKGLTSALRLAAGLLAAAGLFAYAISSETPVGELGGVVLAADTGLPLSGLKVTVRSRLADPAFRARQVTTDARGRFHVGRLPAGDYEVESLASAYQNRTEKAAVTEAARAELTLALDPGDPFLELHVHRRAYLPGERPRVAVHGFRQGDRVRLHLSAVDATALVRDHGSDLRAMLTPVANRRSREAARTLQGSGLTLMREWEHTVRDRDAEGVFYQYERLDSLEPGVYVLAAETDHGESLGWLMVTDLALVTKRAGDRLITFATDLSSGEAVAGAEITVYRGKNSLARATTDPRGLADLQVPYQEGESYAVLAKRGESLAFSRWYRWEGDGPAAERLFLYTDRPVYRPGHAVHFKGVVRGLDGNHYRQPAQRSLPVRIVHEEGYEVANTEVALNGRGSFAGSITLPPSAASGLYRIITPMGTWDDHGVFAIASYRKPEWRVDVETPAKRYVRGDSMPVTVQATYYYGAPVAGADVRYTVYRAPYYAWSEGDDDLQDEETAFFGEVVTEGETRTDAGGHAQFVVPTRGESGDEPHQEYVYNVQAHVTDASERSASGSARVRVAGGEVSLQVRPGRYVAAPGETVSLWVRASALDNAPAAGQPTEVTASLETWDGKQHQTRGVFSDTLRTGPDGTATLDIPMAQAGLVLLHAATTDRRGNQVEATAHVWVSPSGGGDFDGRYVDLSLVADRARYEAGDVAQVMLNTDSPGATALVTIEAEDVLDVQVVPLRQRSTLISVPIRRDYQPNVFISACLVKDVGFRQTEARLNVSSDEHRLQVSVSSDREEYRPGDFATFKISTRDHRGRPRAAEVSFGLVDESIYAVREERRRGIWEAFYPRRPNRVWTEFSYPDVYLGDSDKSGSEIGTRREFPDTAHWDPFVQTDSQGAAEVRVRLPDSLTSWRATAVGHTDSTQVGRGMCNLRVKRDLTVRLQTPRGVVEGDRLTLTAIVHNYGAAAADVNVNLRAQGLTVDGTSTRRVRLATGGSERVAWQVRAERAGEAVVEATAAGGGLVDGMELRFPVQPFVREDVFHQSGALTEAGEVSFETAAEASGGELVVRASPSLSGAVIASLEYLATYPYGCTEQTMSSFLPNVVLTRTLSSLALERPELAQRLPGLTRAGLVRLYGMQSPEGGWGWWEYDAGDPWLTAYVLYGMGLARANGVSVDSERFGRGLDAAEAHVENRKLKPDAAMLLAWVLARHDRKEPARTLLRRSGDAVETMDVRTLAYRALALEEAGLAGERRTARELMAEIWRRAVTTGGSTHWQRRESRVWEGVQASEHTAMALQAALALTPDDPRISGVVRWLLLERRGEQWHSTRDTAWVLLALSDYLKRTDELAGDFQLTLTLNGNPLHEQRMRAAVPGAEAVVSVPLSSLGRRNRLEVRKEGPGVVYYTVQVRQQVPVREFAAVTSTTGLSLSREYFQMEAPRGRLTLRRSAAAPVAVNATRTGQRLLVRLRIRAERPHEFLMLEDLLPAGFEVEERGEVERWDWRYAWSSMDVRDDRVTFFYRDLPRGEHVIEYYLRAEMAGEVRALPALLSDMYAPEVRASTPELRMRVEARR